MNTGIIKELIISPELNKLHFIKRGYTDRLGRKIRQKHLGGTVVRQTITTPNGFRIVSEGNIGETPFLTQYFNNNRELTREINPMYELVKTPTNDEIFISRRNSKRSGDVRIKLGNTKETYTILAHKFPDKEDTFVMIRTYIGKKCTEAVDYIKYKFFDKTNIEYVDSPADLLKFSGEATENAPYPLEEVRMILDIIRKSRK